MELLNISNEHCTVERQNHTLIVTLNRPEQRNILSPEMLLSMYRAWRMLEEDSTLFCAVLTGAGGNFCAGMNLKQDDEKSPFAAEFKSLLKTIPDLHWQAMLKTNRPKKPLILAAEGYALAGGTEIALGTDLRICSENAIFGIPETRMGLFPLGGSTVRLPRQVPYTIAAEILLLGRQINAQEALSWNLVNRVTAKGNALNIALSIADEIGQCAPLSLAAMTQMLRIHSESLDESGYLAKEETVGWSIMSTKDAREGMTAFREKREAVFIGE